MGSNAKGGGGAGSEVAVTKKADNFNLEYQKFLDEFEKPTAIYRLIRTTFHANPRFMYRNLSYMEDRMSRRKNTRTGFTVDKMLKDVAARKKEEEEALKNPQVPKGVRQYTNLVILGFCDGQNWAANTEAEIKIQILKSFGSSRRKEDIVPKVEKVFQESCRIPLKATSTTNNSNGEDSVPRGKGALSVKYPVLSIPRDKFTLVNGHVVHSIKLAIKVSLPASKLLVEKDENFSENVPEKKNRERLSRKSSDANTNTGKRKSLPPGGGGNNAGELVYVGLTTLYERGTGNKGGGINLPAEGDQDLEIRLDPDTNRALPKKRARRETSWEKGANMPDQTKVQEFHKNLATLCGPAKILIALRPSANKMPSTVTSIEPVKGLVTKGVKGKGKAANSNPPGDEGEEDAALASRVIYYFLNKGGVRQGTETGRGVTCPWCSLDCLKLYALFKHLVVCHPRFRFAFSRLESGVKVEVSINESFDGSYTGSAYDLVAQPPGQAFSRWAPPGKRPQLFTMLAFRPKTEKRGTASLNEFFDHDEKNVEPNRSYMIGHNRLYHHTTTCLPIHPREIDVDSEGEPDPEWLRVKTCMMIDEFTDVNEGEKEIMKMWNHHVMHDNYVGDCQITLACRKFVDNYGAKIIEKNVYRNFILHLTNLFDFGLLPAQGFHQTVQALQEQMAERNLAAKLRDAWISNKTSTPSAGNGKAASSSNSAEKMEVE